MAARGPYAKSAALRAHIVDVCTEVFAASGFGAATMSEIARKAGISYTGLVHHFPNKEALLVAVLDARDERAGSFLASTVAIDPITDPAAVVAAMTDMWVDHEAQPALIELHAALCAEAASPRHPAHEHYARRTAQIHGFYTRLYDAFTDHDLLTVPQDAAVLADVTVALLDGALVHWLYHRDDGRLEDTIRAFFGSVVR